MVGSVIKSLVMKGKRVIIPNFGTFLIKDSALNPILTPENVTFSPFLRYNDGFLESELAKATGLHKDEAALKVAEYAQLIKSTVFEKEAIFQIDGLGYFFKDGMGNATFAINLPSEIEGLRPSTDSSKEKSTAAVQSTIEDKDSVETPHYQAKEPAEAAPVAEEVGIDPPVKEIEVMVSSGLNERQYAEVEEEEEKDAVISIGSTNNIPPSKKFSRGMLVGFLLLIACLFTLNFFWSDFFATSKAPSRTKIVLDPIDPEQIVEEKAKVEVKNAAQQEIANQVVATVEETVQQKARPEVKSEAREGMPAKPAAKKENKQDASSTAYVIVLGSFGSSENAQKHLVELSKKNIKASIVTKNKLSSVISAEFKTYEDAQVEQTRLRALGFDGWITRK